MNPVNWAFMMSVLSCLTLAGAAQAPRQAAPDPRQPAISLGFAQFCVGNSWDLRLSDAAPNTPIRLLASSNGRSWELTEARATDADGAFTEHGTFVATAVGSHTLTVDIGGSVSNTLSFLVSDCGGLRGRIVFVSTRDGEGPASGHLSAPYIYVANPDGTGVTR